MASAVRAEADHRVVGNLPLELTSFVGRRRELADARRLFESSRLLTLTGVGGVGKQDTSRDSACGCAAAGVQRRYLVGGVGGVVGSGSARGLCRRDFGGAAGFVV